MFCVCFGLRELTQTVPAPSPPPSLHRRRGGGNQKKKQYYGATIFKASGLSNQHATLAQLGIGIVKVLSTIVSLRVVDHQGRRKLLLIGTVMIIVSLFVFASVSVAHPPPETNATESEIAEDMAGADAGRRWRRGSGGGGARHGEWGPNPSAASLHIQNFRVSQTGLQHPLVEPCNARGAATVGGRKAVVGEGAPGGLVGVCLCRM